MTRNDHILIRSAGPADADAIAVLGVLDGGRLLPQGDVLVAEAAGHLRAAIGSNGVAISDPFWPSGQLVELLRTQLESSRAARAGRFSRRALLRPVAGV